MVQEGHKQGAAGCQFHNLSVDTGAKVLLMGLHVVLSHKEPRKLISTQIWISQTEIATPFISFLARLSNSHFISDAARVNFAADHNSFVSFPEQAAAQAPGQGCWHLVGDTGQAPAHAQKSRQGEL